MHAYLQPVLLLSHGASVFSADPAEPLHQQLRALGRSLLASRPRALLVVSAHFIEPRWTFTSNPWPGTVHDHPVAALGQWRYAVPGDPTLAHQAVSLLQAAGLDIGTDDQRGLDHGAWLVAAPMFPAELQIPVVQLSLQAAASPLMHLQAGRALAPLRSQGVLIATSGGMTHNQAEFRSGYMAHAPKTSASAEGRRFDSWLRDTITRTPGEARTSALLAYAAQADAAAAHPSPEHLLPLFVGLGAAESAEARPLWDGFQYGLSTAAYALA